MCKTDKYSSFDIYTQHWKTTFEHHMIYFDCIKYILTALLGQLHTLYERENFPYNTDITKHPNVSNLQCTLIDSEVKICGDVWCQFPYCGIPYY